MPEFSHICPESHFWDQWSIGVVILEMVAGTDIILAANSFKDVETIANDCSEFLGATFGTLIKALLFRKEGQDLNKII